MSGAWIFGLALLGAGLFAFRGGRWRRAARVVWLLSVVLLYALSTQPVSQSLLLALENRYPFPDAARLKEAQATVVLSAGFAGSSPDPTRPELSRTSIARTLAAVRLHRQAATQLLVVSGGSGDPRAPQRVESAAMRELALELGVPASQIVVEGTSRTSGESAAATSALLRERGVERILLVTSAAHLPRSVRLFTRTGLQVIPCPVDYVARPVSFELRSFVPVLGRFTAVDTALHEYVGLLVDRLRQR